MKASRPKAQGLDLLSWYLQLSVAVQILLIVSILLILSLLLVLCLLIVLNPMVLDHIAKLWMYTQPIKCMIKEPLSG